MTPVRQGRLTVAVFAMALLSVAPLTAQTSDDERSVSVTDELVDVLVGAMSLVDPIEPAGADTQRLLSVLLSDPLVVSVLVDAGAVGIQELSGASPWQSTPERVQELLAQGAPTWFSDAIQVSVDLALPVVTPLNVLLVLAEQPDHSMRAFLAEHELEAQVLAEVARKALRDLGRQFG